ncbi:hypothetical protein BD410DRAFT_794960, partial [Rickenella mellea]
MNALLRPLKWKNRKNPQPEAELELDQFVESDRHFMYQDASRPLDSHTRSPIDSIPSEILEMIFLFTQTDMYSWEYEYRKWIYCAHVSRRWRRVSLSFKHLWTSVHTIWCHIAHTFIRRSGNAPLTLRIALRSDTSGLERQTVDLALMHIYRTRELHLHVEGVEELSQISSSFLQIGLQTPLEILDVRSGLLPLEFPPDIFNQARGSLLSLTVMNVCFPYPPAFLRSITRLHIIWYQRPGSLNLISFLDMLNCCTNLVKLEFCN